MTFLEHEYIIGSHYLPALFNGDDSNLEEGEAAEFDAWAADAQVGLAGHWAGGGEEDRLEFAECEVTGLMGDCHRVVWMQRED